MADRVSVSIAIGGILPANRRGAFFEAIRQEGLSTEWDGPDFDATQVPHGAPLHLFARDVAWGRLDAVAALCLACQRPFVGWSGGCSGAFAPEIVMFSSSGPVQHVAADEDEAPVICRATAERLGSYAAILAYFDAAALVVPPFSVADGKLMR